MHENGKESPNYTCKTRSGHGSPSYEHGRCRGRGAEQAPHQEDDIREQEYPLDREELVHFAKHELKCAGAEPESRRVPANISNGMEVISYTIKRRMISLWSPKKFRECLGQDITLLYVPRHGGGDDVGV